MRRSTRSRPLRKFAQVAQIQSHQRIVRARPLARRAAGQVDAQVALGRLGDRLLRRGVDQRGPAAVANFDHLDVVVRAALAQTLQPMQVRSLIRTTPVAASRPMAPVGQPIMHTGSTQCMHAWATINGPCRGPCRDEARIVVVRRGARPHAVVAARAAVEVDDHRLLAVDQPAVDEELEQALVDAGGLAATIAVESVALDALLVAPPSPASPASTIAGTPTLRALAAESAARRRSPAPAASNVQSTGRRSAAASMRLGQPNTCPRPKIRRRPMAVTVAAALPREPRANENQPVGRRALPRQSAARRRSRRPAGGGRRLVGRRANRTRRGFQTPSHRPPRRSAPAAARPAAASRAGEPASCSRGRAVRCAAAGRRSAA